MFTKIREKNIIKEIKKGMKDTSILKGLILNSVRSECASLLLEGKISTDFYFNVFTVDKEECYWKENYDYIMNY